ncbi:unnamed protein product [Prunus brigantina]
MDEYWFDTISCSSHHVAAVDLSTGSTQNTIAETVNLTGTRHAISDSANKFTVIHKGCDKVCNMMNTSTHHRWSSGGSGCCDSSIPKAINKSLVSEAETGSMGNISFWHIMSSRSKRTRSRLIFPIFMVGDMNSTQQDALIMFPSFYSYNRIVSSSPKLYPTTSRIHTRTKLEYHIKIGIGSSDTHLLDIFQTMTWKYNYHRKSRRVRGYIPQHIKVFPGPAKLTLGLGFCFSCLSFVISGIYFSVKKHKFIKLKSKFFQRNGGLLLEQQIALHGGTTILTAEELDMNADCYKKTHIFVSGDSGTGTSQKGLSPEKVVVEGQIERFISEILTLTKVNHQNVVKFLGCCLETEAPVLVYELACNGTLFDYIHHTNEKSSLPWDILLKIVTESAVALAYLHSAADSSKQMIIHGNVKSSNILLTDCFMAKISGFGPSRLVPSTESQISTLVQETLVYLDPEYLHTGQLTDNSDVYSFGVVLLELLTGEMPVSFDRPENQRVITSYFLLSAEQCGLFQIVAPQLVNEGSREQVRAVADLAKSCLKLSRAERPTMEQVARELHRLSNTYPRVKVDSHDT